MTQKKIPEIFGINSQTVLERSWEGLPGMILLFPVTIGLSGSMSAEREQTIGLTRQERADLLLDFRVRLLGDILTDTPKVLSIEKATEALAAKQDKAYKDYLTAHPLNGEATKEDKVRHTQAAQKVKEETALTEQELEGLYEPFPGWDEITKDAGNLPEAVAKYFNQKSGGRAIFQLLVEAVIQDFWSWATPRPTISVSAFLQSKRLISTTN